jgi:putative hemolysin
MSNIGTEILIIIVLLLLNGLFAMSELAVVTARKVRLEQRAEDGDAGARAALALAHDPTQFLSTVQVGITLIGVLTGAFGGATISDELAAGFRLIPSVAPYADGLALGLVVASITYLSLLLGELIPKRVALSNPERVASLVARPMRLLARVASPLVKLLTGPTNLVLRLFGIHVSSEPSITVEEIRALVEQGAEIGVVEDTEHHMVDGVFRLGDRAASDVMTPRTRLDWIDVSEPEDVARQDLAATARARYLVCDGGIENVLGIVHAEDLLVQCLSGHPLELRSHIRPPLYVPGTLAALEALAKFRETDQECAVVLDEFGGLQGILQLDDIVRAVVGGVDATGENSLPTIARGNDGTWVTDGAVAIEDFETTLDLHEIPPDERRGARTVGGLIMTLAGHVPQQGETIEWSGFRLQVSAMDGRRIVRVVATRNSPGRNSGRFAQSDDDDET